MIYKAKRETDIIGFLYLHIYVEELSLVFTAQHKCCVTYYIRVFTAQYKCCETTFNIELCLL